MVDPEPLKHSHRQSLPTFSLVSSSCTLESVPSGAECHVVVPGARLSQILEAVQARAAESVAESLEECKCSHRLRVDKALHESSFEE
jgi:hypothetical protein